MLSTSPIACEAFSKSAEIYDLIHAGKDYDGEAKRVLELLGPVPRPQCDWLADWGCGTGEFSIRFEDAGWAVVGYDNCEAMIAKAVAKGVNVQHADICRPRNRLEYYAQTCLFAAFSYASASHPPLLILENFRKAAAPGGRLVFDFVNADAELKNQGRDIEKPTDKIDYIGVSQHKRLVDMRQVEITIDYSVRCRKPQHSESTYWRELHYLRTFTAREMAELITRAGWKLEKIISLESALAVEPYYLTAVCSAA